MPDPSLNLSLFDTPTAPDLVDTAPDPQPEYVVTVRQTRTGRDILLYPGPTAPDSAIIMATERSLPLFTAPEIDVMRGAPDHLVEKIILAKVTFPGSSVSQSIQEAAA